jgi:hypothetical protein
MIESSIFFLVLICRRYNIDYSFFLNVIRRLNLDQFSLLSSFRLESSKKPRSPVISMALVVITAVRYPLKNVIISFILPAVLNPVELSPVGDVLKPALDRLSIIASREGGPIFNLEAISSEVK